MKNSLGCEPMSIDEIISQLQIDPQHQPVLLREVLLGLTSNRVYLDLSGSQGGSLRYLDGTFGRGGHYQGLNKYFKNLRTLAFDQDIEASAKAKIKFKVEVDSGALELVHGNFSQFLKEKDGTFDMILLDLGVSSPQLDEAARGFSFYQDGPLDMRMNQGQNVTAEVLINTLSEDDLVRVFKEYGEIFRPFRVVRAIVHDRKTKAFKTTQELAGLIERVDGWHRKGHHPATQYFMALRLAVNQELENLKEALPRLIDALNPGGRLAVISFHSLEDRIVKWVFKESELGEQIHKKVIEATEDEIKLNSRARSAKLRVFEKKDL
jgi:16S rRNA (cytosine1402-N4)-methyltransferase